MPRSTQDEDAFLYLAKLQEEKTKKEKMDAYNAFHQSIPILCSNLNSKGLPESRRWGFDRYGCISISRTVTPYGNGQIMLSSNELDERKSELVPFSSTEAFNPIILDDPNHTGWRFQKKSNNRVKCTTWFGNRPSSGRSSDLFSNALNFQSQQSDRMDLDDDDSKGFEIPEHGTISLHVGCTRNRTKDERTFPYDMKNFRGLFKGNVILLTFPLMSPENCRVYAAHGQPRVFLKLRVVEKEKGRFCVVKSSLDIRFGKESSSCSETKNHMTFQASKNKPSLSLLPRLNGSGPSFENVGSSNDGMVVDKRVSSFGGPKHCMDPSKCATLVENLKEFIRDRIQKHQEQVNRIQIRVGNKKNSLIKLSSGGNGADSVFSAGSIFSTIIRIALMHYLGDSWSLKKNDPHYVCSVLLESCPIGLGEKLKKIYARKNVPGPTLNQLSQNCSGLPEYFPIHPDRAVDYVENQALDKDSDKQTQHDVGSLFDDIFLNEPPGSVCRPSLVGDFVIRQILRCLSKDGNENTIIQAVTDSIGMKNFTTLNNRDFVYSSPSSLSPSSTLTPTAGNSTVPLGGGSGGGGGGSKNDDLVNSFSKMKINTNLPGDDVACLYTPSIFQINNPQGPMMTFKDLSAFAKLFTSNSKSDCGRYLEKICKPRYRLNNDPFQATGHGGWTSFVKSNRLYHELGYFDANTNTLVRVVYCPSNQVECVLTIKGTDIKKMVVIKKKILMKIFSDSDALSSDGVVPGFEVIRPIQAPKPPHYKEWKKYMASSSLRSSRKIEWLPQNLKTIEMSQLPYYGRNHSNDQLKIMTDLANHGCTLSPMFAHPSTSGAGGGIDDRVSIVFKDQHRDYIQLIFHKKDKLQQALDNPNNPYVPLFWDRKCKHFRTHRGDYVIVSIHLSDIDSKEIRVPVLSVSGFCYTANEYIKKHMDALQSQVKINMKNLCSIKFVTHRHSKKKDIPTPHGYISFICREYIPSENLIGRTPSGFTPTLVVYDPHTTGSTWSPAIGPYGDMSDIQKGTPWGFSNTPEPVLSIMQ